MIRGEYFWAFLIVMGFVAAWRVRVQLRPLVAADPSLEPGGRVLVRTILILVTVMAVVNGSLQHFGGFSDDPGWWGHNPISNPYVLAQFIFHALFTVLTLWWVWFANGPARLLKYRAVFSTGQNPMNLGERGLTWFLTIVPVAFMVMYTITIIKNSKH
jgi:hypothetical protein